MVFNLLMDTVKFPLHWASPLVFKGTNRSFQIIKHLLYYLHFFNCARYYYFTFFILNNLKLMESQVSEGFNYFSKVPEGPVFAMLSKSKCIVITAFCEFIFSFFCLNLNKWRISFTCNMLLSWEHIFFCGTGQQNQLVSHTCLWAVLCHSFLMSSCFLHAVFKSTVQSCTMRGPGGVRIASYQSRALLYILIKVKWLLPNWPCCETTWSELLTSWLRKGISFGLSAWLSSPAASSLSCRCPGASRTVRHFRGGLHMLPADH